MSSLSSAARSLKRKLPHARPSSSVSSLPDRPFFPCVDAHAARESRLRAAPPAPQPSGSVSHTPWLNHCAPSRSKQAHDPKPASPKPTPSTPDPGPEPPYARPAPASYRIYRHPSPLALTYGSTLPRFDVAYETWGTLSPAKDNVILLHTGLSASSHAAATPANPAPGWWERFIGPGRALDTDRFFVVCANVLGGCYGSTGPASPMPPPNNFDAGAGEGEGDGPYATRFPIVSIFDMVRAQFALLDALGVSRLYASVGSSMGGMQSLAAGWLFPERVGRVVSISGTARSSPGSIAMRYAQRSVLMADPNWNNGFYYGGVPPHTGMKLARRESARVCSGWCC